MSFALWSSSYETGHPDVDQQHKHLFAMINELHAAMRRGQGRQSLGPLLQELRVYTLEHFGIEEALMRASGYSNLEHHKGRHEDLAGKVEELLLRYSEGYLTIPNTLARFLADWLKHHIREEDMAFIVWLKAQQS